MEGFEFTIHNEVLDFHTMGLIDGVSMSSSSNQCFQFLVIGDFNTLKFNVT